MSKTILVVDDDQMNLRMAQFILSKEAYEVDLVDSGAACLDKLKEKEYDLVLLDIEMPGMDGIQTLENIRKDSGAETLPVIFLTASIDEKDLERANSLGAADYVKKPFLPPDLLKSVGSVLNR